jgi:hypothetical protein
MASTLGVSGVVTANAGVVVDNITIDGQEIDVSSGDLTLDVAGDITLDADGGDFRFKDAGTTIATYSNVSGSWYITSNVSDGDIVFQGNDGGSTISALTLDMSSAGAATFNDAVKLGDSSVLSLGAGSDIEIYSGGTHGTIGAQNGNLTLDVAGDLILDADGGDIWIEDAGTTIGQISNSSTDFVIKSSASDRDLLLKGNDGGSTITALTLDMSDAGSAYFNNKVGVGTTGPGAALHVTHSSSSAYDDDAECIESAIIQNTNGSDGSGVNNYACLGFAVADGATSQGFINYVRTGDNTGKMTFLQRTAGSTYVEHMVIKSDGEIDGNFNDTSDIALKDNVTDMDSSLEAILQLNPSNFRWKGQDKTKSGFIAQDVEKCLPDLVSGEEGKKSIYTLGLVAHLTNAVQELKEIIEKQQKQINDMETK